MQAGGRAILYWIEVEHENEGEGGKKSSSVWLRAFIVRMILIHTH